MPFSKVYRAFPELDRFTDAQCEEWMTLARRAHRRFLMAVGVVLTAMLVPVAGVALVTALEWADSYTGRSWARIGRTLRLTIDNVDILVKGVVIMVVLVPAVLVAPVTRDNALRRVVRNRIRLDRCPKCDYTLLGLPVQGNIVMCPECGATLDLVQLGLTPEEILATTVGTAGRESPV